MRWAMETSHRAALLRADVVGSGRLHPARCNYARGCGPRVNFPSQRAPQFRSMAECISTNTAAGIQSEDVQQNDQQTKEARRRDCSK
jgi:hypothetical protein